MKKDISDIVSRVLSGQSSPQDELFLINWFNSHPEDIDEFRGKERVLNAINSVFARKRFNYGVAYDKFINNISSSKRKPVTRHNIKTLLVKTMKWAAIGLIFMVFGSLIHYLLSNQGSLLEADSYEVIVPAGSRSNLILKDGTSVWLNADSRLSYSEKFGDSDRSVHLEGEGYFEVEKDSESPFTVVTSEVEIVALGTSFNVKSYPDENLIQTTLVSGSLLVNRLKTTEQGLTMEPNQQLTYYRDSRQLKLTEEADAKDEAEKIKEEKRLPGNELPKAVLRRGVDPEIFTSWKDNRLILEDEPFESIAVKLERRFGTIIQIKDEDIGKRRFKGRFEEVTMEQALSALQFVSPFDYYMQNDTIYISSK